MQHIPLVATSGIVVLLFVVKNIISHHKREMAKEAIIKIIYSYNWNSGDEAAKNIISPHPTDFFNL